MNKLITIACLCVTALAALSQDNSVSRPDSHAPIGVMGDHLHKKGEFMFSYRFMSMHMEDNRLGTNDISTDQIVTTIENPFGSPATLRVVPLNMRMNMHMIGGMYAPSDKLTLMAMTMLSTSSMDHVTYQGMSGTTVLGNFTTETSGLGDTKLILLYRLAERMHLNLGVSIPTGSIEETDQILTPMNETPTPRLPYPMQLGSGTWDVLPALTYSKLSANFGWGVQASGTIRLSDNAYDYTLGNKLMLTSWGSYRLADWVSASLRLDFSDAGDISGQDPNIAAPVQTADPANHGGTRVDGLVGVNLIGRSGLVKNHRIAAEFGIPLIQDLNGPQLKVSGLLTIGYQYAF